MSTNLACARARVAAGEWLARYCGIQDPKTMTFSVAELLKAFEEGYLTRINDDVLGGDELTLTATVLDAASSGMGPFTENDLARAAKAMFAARDRIERLIKGQAALTDQRAIERATGQRQLDDATALMREAVDQFRSYERHHMAKVSAIFPVAETSANADTIKKANANALMAMRLEAWLAGKDQYPTSFEREHPPGYFSRIELPRRPGSMSLADQQAQEGFVSAALDAGVDQIGEADEPSFYSPECKVDPASLEGVDHHTIEDCRQRFENGAPFAGFAAGGVVTGATLREGEIPAVLTPGLSWTPGNAADVARQIGEAMVDGVTIKGVDHESFDRGAAYLDQPVEISAIMAPPLAEATLTMAKDAPAQSLADVRRHWAEGAGFKYWEGGEGPPADLDEDGEVMIDWGEQTESGPRFTMCGVAELTPMPGLWAETIDPDSFGTIIGYHADPTLRPASKVIEFKEPISTPPTRVEGRAEYPTPADAASDGKSPRAMIAAEPDPLAALVHARNWLISAESLIAEASAFIRGVTGANPGSDSADLCERLDAWLTPMATRPADEGAEKEARRSSTTME